MSAEEIRKAQIQQQVEREHQELMKAAKQVCSSPDPILAQWMASRLRETKSSCITIHSFQSTVKFVSLSYEIALVSIPALKQRAKKEKTPPPPPKTITVMAGITRLCSYENWLLFCLPLWATNSWILKMLYNNDVEFRPFRRPPLNRAPPLWQLPLEQCNKCN